MSDVVCSQRRCAILVDSSISVNLCGRFSFSPLFENPAGANAMRSVSLQAITQLLIDFYAVSFEEITHPSDADKLMILYICVYLVKSNTCYSDSSIAEFFNIEDEDDIERIVDSVSEFMRSRFAFRAEIDILKEIIHEEFASTARNIYKKNYIEKDKPDPINILTGS